MKAVLDTSVLIAGDTDLELRGELSVSSASLAELHFGVLVARDEEIRAQRLDRLTRIESLFDPLPLDSSVAHSYGRVAAAVVRFGWQPRSRVMDLLIAATAHAHGAAVYTRNPEDFRGLDELVDVVGV